MPFVERIIIADDNKYYKAFVFFNMWICIISSYIYAYMAAFYAPKAGDTLYYVSLFFELWFLLDITLKFLKSFTKDGETVPTIDLNQIATRYLKGKFVLDFIPLIPVPRIFEFHGENQFYIIKCIRIVNGFAAFDVSNIMTDVRKIFSNRLDKVIANDPLAAEDITLDQNKIN